MLFLRLFRLKGQRTRYHVSAVSAFEHAVKVKAFMEHKRKKEEREQRRRLRREGGI